MHKRIHQETEAQATFRHNMTQQELRERHLGKRNLERLKDMRRLKHEMMTRDLIARGYPDNIADWLAREVCNGNIKVMRRD